MKLFIPATCQSLATSLVLGAGASYTITVNGIFTANVVRPSTAGAGWQLKSGTWANVTSKEDAGAAVYSTPIVAGAANELRLYAHSASTYYIVGVYWG